MTFAANSVCKVEDLETGFTITFRDGLFNETQRVTTPDNLTEEQIQHAATTMREIGDWLGANYPERCTCHAAARCAAIWTLSNEHYWLAMADALNGTLIDWGDIGFAARLFYEMDDYKDTAAADQWLNEAEKCNLLGSLSLISDEEAKEVIDIIYNFWHTEDADIQEWARDVLWWPAWCPDELKTADEDE